MTETASLPRGFNPVRDRVVDAVDRLLAAQSRRPMRYDDRRGAWIAESVRDAFTPPVPLQRGALAADVTDRGVLLLPVGRAGRFAVDIRLATEHEVLEPVRMAVLPQKVELDLEGAGVAVRVTIRITDDGLEWAPALLEGAAAELRPFLVWTPASAPAPVDPLASPLPARSLDVVDEIATRSNSRLPDPLPPEGLPLGAPLVRVTGETRPATGGAGPQPASLIAERATPNGTIVSALPTWSAGAPGRLVIACDDVPNARPLDHPVEATFDTGMPALDRQLRFSVPTSLASSVRRPDGRIIALHGRRDRGMGDVAHLHQSHQMHFVALASGATGRVRDELLAQAALQDPDGAIRRSPGIGTDSYVYVPGFTDVHLLTGTHRYVAWTGDDGILDSAVVAADGPRPLRDRLVHAARSMLDRGVDGLLAPCGWLDAWPPTVRAQAQVSIEGAAAIESLVDLLHADGRDDDGLAEAAARLRRRIDEVFYDDATGLYAEHLFDDGVTGGTIDDFWSHTQISAVLAGQTADRRGLDLVRERCWFNGVMGLTPSTLDAPYVADSTDADVDLELDSTAMWLLAAWPELTNRFALAEIEVGRPERGVAALEALLPERMHGKNPVIAPWYYAEKYLYPGVPWLFTWGGDPTLVEAVLGGLLGIRPTLTGLDPRPVLPADAAAPLSAEFTYRGTRLRVTADPAGGAHLEERVA